MIQHNPPHPGEVLKDGVFESSTLTVTDFAKQIGVTRAALSRVLNGKAAISPDMALRIADALGAMLKAGYTCKRIMTYGKPDKDHANPFNAYN